MDAFKQRMKDYLKDEYPLFEESLNKENKKGLYLNKKKHGESIVSHLNKHPYVKDGYYFDPSIFPAGKLPYYLAGLYYIQEPSSMITATLLNVNKGDKVLDMCAAPGGKSCMLLNQLEDTGLLIANDIDPLRSKILSENIERFGATNTIVTNSDPVKFSKEFKGYFDKILLDAPCSGEGMFRSKDKAIETYSLEKIKECVSIQKRLIDTAYTCLKKDGYLLYSTCTYNQYENEEMIQYALDNYDFKLIPLTHQEGFKPGINMQEVIRLYPHSFEGEGQFIALLQKTGETSSSKIKDQKSSISPTSLKIVSKFFKDYLNIPLYPNLIENNGHIYAIKDHFPIINKIKILRNGLYLGEVKKNYFVPSHSLCLALNKEDFKKVYNFNLDDQELKDYIHGLTLESKGYKGFGAICVNDYPIGFFKESNQIKNYFPKGLRRYIE